MFIWNDLRLLVLASCAWKLLLLHVLRPLNIVRHSGWLLLLLVFLGVCALDVEISPAANLVGACLLLATIGLLVALVVGLLLIGFGADGEVFVLLILLLGLLPLLNVVLLLVQANFHHLPSIVEVKYCLWCGAFIRVGEWTKVALKSVSFLL